MSEEMVTISASRLKELLRSEKILEALELGGVDNWQWYEQCLEDLDLDDEDE